MSHAFVTGGSGFVGRNLIRALVERGDTVHALARSPGSADVVEELGAQSVRGDLSSVEAMVDAMEGCDAAFHSAALVDHWGAPERFRQINIEGTQNVLVAARRAGVPRLVHVSTEAVLVDGSPLRGVDETRPIPERHLGLYPWSKAQAEERVRAANGDGLTTVIIRPRLIWGRDDTSVLPQVLEAIESGAFRWFDGGHYLTSTCHVANVVEGALLAAERGEPGATYFLTDGDPIEFREFITRLTRTQGVEPGDGELPLWLGKAIAAAAEAAWRVLPLSGQPPLTRTALALLGDEVTVSDAKARRDLGYQAHISIDDGLAELER